VVVVDWLAGKAKLLDNPGALRVSGVPLEKNSPCHSSSGKNGFHSLESGPPLRNESNGNDQWPRQDLEISFMSLCNKLFLLSDSV
jgi:hypothetical protein